MRNLTQIMRENNVTDKQMYEKYQAFRIHMSKNRSFGMSMRMAFSGSEQFVLAALGLNYLEDALIHRTEDPKQGRLFS